MSTQSETVEGHLLWDEQKLMKIEEFGSISEAMGGAAAVVLAILGLAGYLSGLFLAIGVIAIGVALLFEGGAILGEYSELLTKHHARSLRYLKVGFGMTAEFLGGLAGIVLGVLALLHVASMTLIASAAVVFGVSLLLGGRQMVRLNSFWFTEGIEHREGLPEVAHEIVIAATDAQMLIAVFSVALGILALVGLVPSILSLVAMLILGCSVLLTGAAVSGRVLSLFRR